MKKRLEKASQGGPLHPRERAILGLMAQGKFDKVIVHELGISLATLKTYKLSMYRRLGAKNAPHAVALAFEKGVLHVGLREAA